MPRFTSSYDAVLFLSWFLRWSAIVYLPIYCCFLIPVKCKLHWGRSVNSSMNSDILRSKQSVELIICIIHCLHWYSNNPYLLDTIYANILNRHSVSSFTNLWGWCHFYLHLFFLKRRNLNLLSLEYSIWGLSKLEIKFDILV